jgi:outer membrane protein assembly factor BamB
MHVPKLQSSFFSVLRLVILTPALAWSSSPVLAQIDPESQSKTNAAHFGVSLPDSPAAADLLKRAAQEESQQHWENAAELYEQAENQFQNRVVPMRSASDSLSSHYCGVAEIVQDRMSKWPEEAIRLYDAIYEPTASELLKSARPGDSTAISNVFWNYFPTESGKAAGIRLIDFYLEDGDFLAASWIGNRLLQMHPALGADRGITLYRTALADHYAGDRNDALELLNRLKLVDPDATGDIGGKQVQLVDSLTAILAAPPLLPVTRASDADTYDSFGGAGGCGELSVARTRFSPRKLSVQLCPSEYPGATGPQLAAFHAADQSGVNLGPSSFAIIPVIDDGELFFQDGRSLYAVDTLTATPLPRWLSTYPGDHHGQYKLSAFGRARSEMLTLTVSPKVVLAVMGQPDRMAQPINTDTRNLPVVPPVVKSETKLVCLDRLTGRQLWSQSPADLPNLASTLNKAVYDGTPLIVPARFAGPDDSGHPRDAVLITARTGRLNQFDDCYLVCLSLKTGKYRWSTYLGGATQNQTGHAFSSQIAFNYGRVFVGTNLGAVAALDASTGRMIWLNSYAHDAGPGIPNALGRNALSNDFTSTAWLRNPVIVSNGRVFVLPNDAAEVFVYDANTGLELKSLPMIRWDNAGLLLGVRDDQLLLNSETKVFGVDWQRFDSSAGAAAATRFSSDISFVDNSRTCARGFVTAESVFIPTTNRLVEIARGRAVATYPAHGSFNQFEGPGNILVSSRAIVIARQTQVDIYTASIRQ